MSKLRMHLAFALVVGLPFVAPAVLRAQDTPLARLDDYVTEAMPQWQVPGVAIAVIKDDKVVHAKGYGLREIGTQDAVDERTVFAIASNSKAFTCALLGMLVDEGKLRWDDRVSEILPWFQVADAFVTRDLRVVDLVTHRVGLPTFGGDHLWIGSDYGRREILTRIRYQELTAPFRMSFQYQNIMYTAAGEIIPAKVGKSWSEFVRMRLLEPLDMRNTSTSIKALSGRENVATPHEVRGGKLTTMEYDDVDAIAAAAALNSNVLDVAKWLRFNLAGGTAGGQRLISQQVMAQMVHSNNNLPSTNGFRSYGLGWFMNDYQGRKVISHGGGLTGMISKTTWVPAENLGIVVLTNMAENSLPAAITNWIMDRYFGSADKDWNALYLLNRDRNRQRKAEAAKQMREKRLPDTSPSLPLGDYTGTYHNPLPGDAKVTLDAGRLHFHYNRRHRGYLTHWQHDTFRIVWINNIMDMEAEAFVRFELDEHSRVIKLHTRWYHPITFEKKR